MAEHINIGGRLHSTATGNIVAGANEIQDDTLNKKQSEINNDVITTLIAHDNIIQGLNSQNYESYSANEETTSIDMVLPDLGVVNTIYRLGNWDGNQYDTTQYAEYAWKNTGIDQGEYVLLNVKNYGIDDEPTAGSNNLVKSGGVYNGIIQKIKSYNVGYHLEFSANNTQGSYLISSESPNYPIYSEDNEQGIISNYIPLGVNAFAIILRGLSFKKGGSIRLSQDATPNGIAYKISLPWSQGQATYTAMQDTIVLIPKDLTFTPNYITVLVNRIDNGDTPVYGGTIDILSEVEYREYIDGGEELIGVNIFASSSVREGKYVSDIGVIGDSNKMSVSKFYKIPKAAKKIVYNGFLASDSIRCMFSKYNFDNDRESANWQVVLLNETGHGEIDLANYRDYNYIIFTVFRASSASSPTNLDIVDIRFENDSEHCNSIQVFDVNKVRTNKSVSTSSPYPIVDVTRNQVLTHYIPIPKWAKSIKYSGIIGAFDWRCRFAKYPKDDGAAISLLVNSSGNGEIDITSIDTDIYHYFTMPVFLGTEQNADLSKVSIELSGNYIYQPNLSIDERGAWLSKPNLYVKKPKVCFIMDGHYGDILAYLDALDNVGVKSTVCALPNQLYDLTYSHITMQAFQRGHEINIHSDSNGSFNDDSTWTEEQVRYWIEKYINDFKTFNLPFPFGWITMNGKMKDSFISIVEEYMSYAAVNANIDAATYTGDYDDVVNKVSTKYNFNRFCIDNLGYDDSVVVDKVKNAIDKCIEEKGLLILYGHGYGASQNNSINVATLSGVLSYLTPLVASYRIIVGRCDEMFNLHY